MAIKQCRYCGSDFEARGGTFYYCDAYHKVLDKINPDSQAGCWEWLGSKRGNGYGQVWVNGKSVLVHRYLYIHHYGVMLSRDQVLDHVVCSNRVCCNPAHLRATTHTNNIRRQQKSRANTSGYKGVSWHRCQKWQAKIRVNGVRKYLGYFTNPTDAARAYDAAAIEHFGIENAVLNFPADHQAVT